MTPRTFWDKNSNLWELHPGGHSVRVLWDSKIGPSPTIFGGWIPRWMLERSILGPLVATC